MSREREIKGQVHTLVLLRVLEWDDQGRPSKCIVGYDDTEFRIDNDQVSNEFMTAYVPKDMTTIRRKDN